MPDLIRHPGSPMLRFPGLDARVGGISVSVDMERQPAVYILASDRNGTLYVGVTSDLMRRVYEHRAKFRNGFAARHGVSTLVWFEMHDRMDGAIEREKKLKNWRRSWKLALIEAENPRWRDLAIDLGFAPQADPDPADGRQRRDPGS